MTNFLISLAFISFLTTAVFSPLMIILAKKYGLVDDPQKRPHPAHTHKGIIPRGGGLPIFLGIFLPFLIFSSPTKPITGIILGAVILILVGLWDDLKDRSPYIRLLTNSLAVLLAVGFGVGIPHLTNPFGGTVRLDTWIVSFDFFGRHSVWIWADLFAFILIFWMTNIVGWSGGVDGQLPGFVAISSLVIGLLSLRFISLDPNQLPVAALSFATFGAFLGFLPWNFYPQKIMPGYGGKTLAGFMLATLSILSFSKLGTALLVLAVPLIDAIIILITRIFSGKSPVFASVGHLHHHLLSLGWGRRRVAIFYWFVSAITGIIALNLKSRQKVFAGLIIIVLVLGFMVLVNILTKLKEIKDRNGSSF